MMRIGVGYQNEDDETQMDATSQHVFGWTCGSHGAACSRSVASVADGLRQNMASKQVLAARSEIEAAVQVVQLQ